VEGFRGLGKKRKRGKGVPGKKDGGGGGEKKSCWSQIYVWETAPERGAGGGGSGGRGRHPTREGVSLVREGGKTAFSRKGGKVDGGKSVRQHEEAGTNAGGGEQGRCTRRNMSAISSHGRVSSKKKSPGIG